MLIWYSTLLSKSTENLEKLSMPVKLFILGLPGSGKSAVARYISAKIYTEGQHWAATRFNDYKILHDMFNQDTSRRFKRAEPRGFDVLDLKVFDEALQTLEQEVNMYIDSLKPEENKLVLVEFSRNDYEHAFQQFNKSFLRDAYFLYLDTELEKCKERIRDRVAKPQFEEDHLVSVYIFEAYYYADDGSSIADILAKEYGVDNWRVLTIDNNRSLGLVCKNIVPFIHTILNPLSIVNK
jgi:thymidylate kinase